MEDRRFKYDHLPLDLQEVSAPFAELAQDILEAEYLDEATKDKALDKLFEAKNLVVLATARPS